MNYGESEQNDRRIIASILKGWSLISLPMFPNKGEK